MAEPSHTGRTFWDVVSNLRPSRLVITATAVAGAALLSVLWYFVHSQADPGTEVSLLAGLIKYQKAKTEDAALMALRAKVKSLEQERSSLAGQVENLGKAALEKDREIERLRLRPAPGTSCSGEKRTIDSLNTELSSCKSLQASLSKPPSTFLFTFTKSFSTIPDCKDKLNSAFARLDATLTVTNYPNALGLIYGRYLIYVSCASPEFAIIAASGPEYVESERLARLVASYVTSQ
jgi:hypothetical protein